jgi:hypothetical protein
VQPDKDGLVLGVKGAFHLFYQLVLSNNIILIISLQLLRCRPCTRARHAMHRAA